MSVCAHYSGATFYYTLDVVPLARQTDHVAMLYMLVYLFRHRAPRPTKGWPDFDDYLDSDLFPHHILSDMLLRRSLDPDESNPFAEAWNVHTLTVTCGTWFPGGRVISRQAPSILF